MAAAPVSPLFLAALLARLPPLDDVVLEMLLLPAALVLLPRCALKKDGSAHGRVGGADEER